MDEIEERLKTCTENCVKAYSAWSEKKKDVALRETLQEAVHELRKVAARLEIEVAKSEGGERVQNPLPIPSHRSKRPHDDRGNSNGKSRGKSSGRNNNKGKSNGKSNASGKSSDELPSFISGDKGADNKGDKKKAKKPNTEGKLSLDSKTDD